MENIGIYKKFNNIFIKHYYFIYFWLIILLILLTFINIRLMPINQWDEARHGVNAYEMIRENNYIANYYNGKLDYWNLKPPLSYYTIILGYKLFGFNELGLRFFSAISYILTAIIISLFLKNKKDGSEKASLLSLLFMSSLSYLFFLHAARTGDADGIFLLFFTIGLISLIKTEDNERYLYVTGLMFSFMFLTKSFHSLFFIPVVFFYLLFTKGFIRIKWYRILLFLIISAIPILIWALFRYRFDGFEFFKLMFEYDLLNRSSNSIEGHNEIFIFYLLILLASAPGLLIFLTLYIIKKFKLKEKVNYEIRAYLITFFIIFIMYTIAKSKLVWYIYPAFIPLVMISSIVYSKLDINNVFIKLKKFAFIITIIEVVISLVYVSIICMHFDFIALNKYNCAQSFIEKIEYKDIDLYIEYDNQNTFRQDDLLKAELYLNAFCHDGGYEEFINDDNSYLIINKKIISKIDISSYKILFEDNDYCLIYNE